MRIKILILSLAIITFIFPVIACDEDDTYLQTSEESKVLLTDLGYVVLNLTQNIDVHTLIKAFNAGKEKPGDPFVDPGITANGRLSGTANLKKHYRHDKISNYISPVNIEKTFVYFNDYSDSKDYKYSGIMTLSGIMTYQEYPPKVRFTSFRLEGKIKVEGKYQDNLELSMSWTNEVLTVDYLNSETNNWSQRYNKEYWEKNINKIPLNYN